MRKIILRAIFFILSLAFGATVQVVAQPQPLSGKVDVDNGTLINPTVVGGNVVVTNMVTGLTYYVAPPPLGNDTNTGLSQFTPLYSVEAAERLVKAGDTIHLMDGTNAIGSTINSLFPLSRVVQLPNGVNWYSEPNAWIVIPDDGNGNGDTTHGLFSPAGNNIINNLNFLCNDQVNSETCIGYGQQDVTAGHTNIIFNNLNLISYGTGIHVENSAFGTSNLVEMVFNNPRIVANAAPIVLKGWRNLRVMISGGDITVMNFTNNTIANFKPLRAVNLETSLNLASTSSLICSGVTFHLSDSDLSSSNRPAYWIWSSNIQRTNVATFTACTIDWLSQTNPGSLDISTNFPGSLNVFGCVRTDGKRLTYPPGNAPNFGILDASVAAGSIAAITNTAVVKMISWPRTNMPLLVTNNTGGRASGSVVWFTRGAARLTFSNNMTFEKLTVQVGSAQTNWSLLPVTSPNEYWTVRAESGKAGVQTNFWHIQ